MAQVLNRTTSMLVRLVRRYFWITGVAAVSLCVFFGVSAANHLAEARQPTDMPEAYAFEPVAAASPSPPPTKDDGALVERNIFCSGCAPTSPLADADTGDDDEIPLTLLPLELLATNIAERHDWSFATVRDRVSSHQGSFWIGDTVPGAGAVERIGGTAITFHNPATNRLERLSLFTPKPEQSKPAPAAKRRKRASPYAESIRKLDATSFEIDRSLVKKLMANPATIRGARFAPHEENGRIVGFRASAVRPRSLFGELGVRSGDVINSVNGMQLSSPDKLLELYGKVRGSDRFSIEITRRGKPVTMTYAIK